jgi:hypothetical protein
MNSPGITLLYASCTPTRYQIFYHAISTGYQRELLQPTASLEQNET